MAEVGDDGVGFTFAQQRRAAVFSGFEPYLVPFALAGGVAIKPSQQA